MSNRKYIVEEVLDKRTRDGLVEYYLKRKGHGHEDYIWKPEEKLHCPKLIEKYERKRAKREAAKRDFLKRKAQIGGETSAKKTPLEIPSETNEPKGFDHGLVPEKIIGASNQGDERSIAGNSEGIKAIGPDGLQ